MMSKSNVSSLDEKRAQKAKKSIADKSDAYFEIPTHQKTKKTKQQSKTPDDILGKKLFTEFVLLICFVVIAISYLIALTISGAAGISKWIHITFWVIMMYYTGSKVPKDDPWYLWPVWYATLILLLIYYVRHY